MRRDEHNENAERSETREIKDDNHTPLGDDPRRVVPTGRTALHLGPNKRDAFEDSHTKHSPRGKLGLVCDSIPQGGTRRNSSLIWLTRPCSFTLLQQVAGLIGSGRVYRRPADLDMT